METTNDKKSNHPTLTNLKGQKPSQVLNQTPANYSRAGQAFVMLSPKQNEGIMNLSEKELNRRSNEEAIQAIMNRTGKSRDEVELMLSDPF